MKINERWDRLDQLLSCADERFDLYAALVPEVYGPTLMPEWMAQFVSWSGNRCTDDAWLSIGQSLVRTGRRWSVLDDLAWSRIRAHWLQGVLSDVRQRVPEEYHSVASAVDIVRSVLFLAINSWDPSQEAPRLFNEAISEEARAHVLVAVSKATSESPELIWGPQYAAFAAYCAVQKELSVVGVVDCACRISGDPGSTCDQMTYWLFSMIEGAIERAEELVNDRQS